MPLRFLILLVSLLPLLPAQRPAAGNLFESDLVEGDIMVHWDAAIIAPTPARLWTNNTIPYVIDSHCPEPRPCH